MSLTFAELKSRLSKAELIPLLCAVSELLDDPTLVAPQFRPRLSDVLITIPPNAGLPKADADNALDLVTRRLWPVLNRGPISESQACDVESLIDFLADDKRYNKLLLEQLRGSISDTWTKEDIAPDREFTVAIIGAGPSGLAMAHALQTHKIPYHLYDENDNVGGTWWLNDYPGCRLDTGRLSYSYSFYQKKDWSSYYTPQDELLKYYEDFVRDHDLRPNIFLKRKVQSLKFDSQKNKWLLQVLSKSSNTIKTFLYDVVVPAVGILTEPSIPKFDGIEQFQGEIIHSSRWDHNLEFANKQVSLIGTGASSFQIGPAIVDQVAQLNVFQRNPPWVLPAPNYHDVIDNSHDWLCANLPNYHKWERVWEFWLFAIGKYSLSEVDVNWGLAGSMSYLNEQFRSHIANHIILQYTDRPDLIDKVLPKYPITAKRMLRDNGVWAEMLKRSHTRLITGGIKRVLPNAVEAMDGSQYQTDILICATGFQTSNILGTMDIIDKNGKQFADVWKEDPISYNTIMLPDCPNLFALDGPNTGLVTTGNQIYMSECAIGWIMRAIKAMLDQDASSMEAKSSAAERFTDWVHQGTEERVWGKANVGSWYKNSKGKVIVSWPYSLADYWEITRDIDKSDVVFKDKSGAEIR